MGSKSVTSALGLYRTPNPLGGAQEGGYARLDNCVIRSKDVIEPRRGQTQVSTWIGGNASDNRRINALFPSVVGELAQYGSGTPSGVGSLDDAFTSAILSDVDPPSAWVRTRFADQAKRCYLTSDVGLKRIDTALAGAAAGGLECKIETDQSHPVYSTSGQFPVNSVALFRAALVTFAPDGAEIVGPASNRLYMRVANSQTVGAGQAARVSNVVTVNTPVAHNLRPGDAPNITWNAADIGAGKMSNGAKTIASVPSATSFTFAETAADYPTTQAAALAMGAASASIRIKLPSTATASTVVRLWRSETNTTSGVAIPSDDVYQVFEAYLTAANISAGYVQISDNTPEVLLGNPSHFSPSVEGEAGDNGQPPLAWAAAPLGDALLLGNLTFKHSLEVRLISSAMSPPQGLTFERVGYTTLELKSTYGPVTDEYFIMYNGGTVARDIEATAISICAAINSMASNNWLDAYYISGGDKAPGMMLFRVRDFVATAFTVKDATSPTFWAPNLPSTGTVATSRQEVADADLMISKSGQPDAFPGIQRVRVGSAGEKILDIKQVRDKAVVLKEASAWLVSGAWPNLRVELLDDTVEFPLPDTAAVMDGQVFVLSSVGVVSVSESGVANMGAPLEGDLRAVVEQAQRIKGMLAAGYTGIHALASWGAVDELEHRYLLGVPASVGVPSATPAAEQRIDNIWVFNASGRAWSGPWPCRHRHAAPWKGASSSSRLVFARHDRPGVLREAGIDANTMLQFSDYLGQSLYVSAISGNNVTLLAASTGAPTAGGLEAGDALYVSATGYPAVIQSVTSEATGAVVVDDASGLAVGTVLVLKGYEARGQPVPLHSGALPEEKAASEVTAELSEARFMGGTDAVPTAAVLISTELSRELVAKRISRPGFGSDDFGSEPFGQDNGLRKERCGVPPDAARGVFHSIAFRTREAGAFWRLHGLSLESKAVGAKGTR